jgi:hypothetical protein
MTITADSSDTTADQHRRKPSSSPGARQWHDKEESDGVTYVVDVVLEPALAGSRASHLGDAAASRLAALLIKQDRHVQISLTITAQTTMT